MKNPVNTPFSNLKTQRLLNIDEAASYLGRTPGALRMMIHRGSLPVVRLGGRRVQLDREDLDRLIEVNKTRETIF